MANNPNLMDGRPEPPYYSNQIDVVTELRNKTAYQLRTDAALPFIREIACDGLNPIDVSGFVIGGLVTLTGLPASLAQLNDITPMEKFIYNRGVGSQSSVYAMVFNSTGNALTHTIEPRFEGFIYYLSDVAQ